MKYKQLPRYIMEEYGTARGFRQSKRREAHRVRRVLKHLYSGCAFTPAASDIRQVGILLDRIVKNLSQANWGK
jgi:hypothetical protein